jgi:CheY-like chemotaxis protein
MLAPTTSAHVLVVDDDLPLLRSVDRNIRELGYRVLTARDAIGALDVLRTTRFAMLMLDVTMPGLDGIELARCVRAGIAGPLNAQVAIVFVTGDDTATTYEATFEVGAVRYLRKPLYESSLREVLAMVMVPSGDSPDGVLL